MVQAETGRILHFVVQTSSGIKCYPGVVITDSVDGEIELEILGIGGVDNLKLAKANNLKREAETWHWPRACQRIKQSE